MGLARTSTIIEMLNNELSGLLRGKLRQGPTAQRMRAGGYLHGQNTSPRRAYLVLLRRPVLLLAPLRRGERRQVALLQLQANRGGPERLGNLADVDQRAVARYAPRTAPERCP